MNNRLAVKDLHFSYRKGEEILKGLDFTIDERPTAIIGQNGAGKTTLVKLIKGLLKPSRGRIMLGDTDLTGMSAARIASRVGMVFQNPDDQIFKNEVLDEVMFGPLKIGMDKETALEKAQEAMDMAGLTGLEKMNPYDLGLSMRKMVAIASILAMDTEIVILDEPTIAQDHEGKMRIRKIVRSLQNQGKKVITIVHDMDFVAEAFERAIVLAEGEVLLEGGVREVFGRQDILKRACLEQPGVTRLGHRLQGGRIYLNAEEFIAGEKARR